MEAVTASDKATVGACGLEFDKEYDTWMCTVRNTERIHLAVSFVLSVLPFAQVSLLADFVKDHLRKGSFGPVSKAYVAQCVGLVVCANLQKMSDILRSVSCWAFSIVFDGATVQSTSFLDIRVRFSMKGAVENVHLLAIPIHNLYTGLAMFELVKLVLDNLVCQTCGKGSSYAYLCGADNMTGRLSGAVNRLRS